MTVRTWLLGYRLLLRWQALRIKPVLPFVVVAQFFTGLGTVIGLGYLMPHIDPTSASFLVTGAATLSLTTLGFVLVPQFVAAAKAEGSFDYMWSLPISRLAYLAADLTIWATATLPGVIVALIVGSLRYDFTLHVSPLVVPAFLLIILTATSVGQVVALLAPKPELVNVMTNLVIFAMFLFSPINFPIERLPGWLAWIHRLLPVKYAADAVRGTLIPEFADGLGLALAVLAAWCVAGLAGSVIVSTRRR